VTNVVDLESVRERQLEVLTQRALRLPRYKRLAVMVAACELLRECRRTKPAAPAAELTSSEA
jgi:hypothetical protein